MSRRTLYSVLTAAAAVVVLTVVALTTPGEARARPPYRITLHASLTTVTSGETVAFSGRVRPVTAAMRKQDVKLQIGYPNGLSETADLDHPNVKGRYAFSESFGAPGTYVVRARIAAGKGHSEGISQSLKITVVPLSVP